MNILQVINGNIHDFLIVVNNEFKVIGVITDGDIRRVIIKGVSISDVISDSPIS